MALVSEAEARALFGGSADRLESIVRRFAGPRDIPVKILAPLAATQGHPFDGELARWIEVFERYEMEVADPAYAELRAPGTKLGLFDFVDKRGPSWVADLVGFFSACSVIVQQDEMSYLASWASTFSGTARVLYFHPSDWGLWPTDPSIAARLFRLLQEEDRPEFSDVRFEAEEADRMSSALKLFEAMSSPETLPPHLDPVRLFPRTEWVVHALLGVGPDLEVAVTRAATYEDWERERPLVRDWPHLAAYWLWSHFLFDNRRALAEAVSMSSHLRSPVVTETLKVLDRIRSAERVRVGDRDRGQLEALGTKLAEMVPDSVLESSARARRDQRRLDAAAENEEANAALAALVAVKDDEPLVEEALELLEHLRRGGALAPPPIARYGGLDVDAGMDRLAELMDARFRPLVLARLERALRVQDTHEEASWGLLLAWAAVARDFAEFIGTLRTLGTDRLGPRRLTELYRAYGRFPDPDATRLLAAGARAWLAEMDDWIRMAPDEALYMLLRRDTLETHEVLADLLERATFSPANWDMCVRAAEAAGELKSKRAIPGLRRAVDHKLGRVDDGGRARVVRALSLADPAEGAEFLRRRFEEHVDAWEAAIDEDDVFELEKDVACYLTGMLPLCPEDPHAIQVARVLLDGFRLKLGPERRPRRDVIAAAQAVIAGVHAGEVRALIDAITPYAELSFHETPSTEKMAAELRGLARLVHGELAA